MHLLLAPDDSVGIGKLMQRLAGRHTRSHNRSPGYSGTLWEGRYKSSPVQATEYLLACCRYIELNPVRADIASDPADYPWSSFRLRLAGATDRWLDLDSRYLALGDRESVRQERYRQFLRDATPDGEANLIREAIQRCRLTGTDRFTEEIAAITGRRIERRGRGRPVAMKASE